MLLQEDIQHSNSDTHTTDAHQSCPAYCCMSRRVGRDWCCCLWINMALRARMNWEHLSAPPVDFDALSTFAETLIKDLWAARNQTNS